MTTTELIQKIKAEIERRMDKHWEGLPNADAPEDDWTHNELCELGAYKELEHLETFLDSLESEKPVPADLEEAAEEYADCNSRRWQEDGDIYYDHHKIVASFIAGAKWQAEQLLKSSPIPEDTVLFNKGVAEGKRLMMEDFPKWLVDDDYDYDELTDKGRFILGSVGIGYNGYYIPYSDLLKLPKEDEK